MALIAIRKSPGVYEVNGKRIEATTKEAAITKYKKKYGNTPSRESGAAQPNPSTPHSPIEDVPEEPDSPLAVGGRLWGLDYLGGAKFKDIILAEHPSGWAAGFFTRVDGFGDSLPVIDTLLATGRAPLIRVHLMWKDRHDFKSSDIPFVRGEARRLKRLIQKYPSVLWRVSPCCEHTLNESQWTEFARAVESELPPTGWELVNTPMSGGFVSDYILNESHGGSKNPKPGRHGFSFDGANCVDADVETYKKNYKNAEYFMFWNCQMNGRLKTDDTTPRPQRKAYPISRQIDSWIYLNRSCGQVSLPNKWIYKSHSDQHTTPPAGKDQKPVIIMPNKVGEIVLKTRNGQVIDKARYYGPFAGGGHRYYCSDWGYLLAEKARRIQGDSLCDIFVNGRKVGVLNPAFRGGVFR